MCRAVLDPRHRLIALGLDATRSRSAIDAERLLPLDDVDRVDLDRCASALERCAEVLAGAVFDAASEPVHLLVRTRPSLDDAARFRSTARVLLAVAGGTNVATSDRAAAADFLGEIAASALAATGSSGCSVFA